MNDAGANTAVAEPRRGPGYFIIGTLLNVIIFLAIGPLVGCFIFLLFAGASGAGIPQSMLITAYMFVFLPLMVIPMAYMMGWHVATATGVVVAIASIWLRNARVLYVFASVAGATATVAVAAYRWNDIRGATTLLVYAATGAIAAAVCTRIARPFRLARKETAE